MRNVFTGLLVVCVLAAFFLGYASNLSIQSSAPSPTPILFPLSNSDVKIPPSNDIPLEVIRPEEGMMVKMKLPAVDKEGVGQLADLMVEARKGQGRVYIGFEESPIINADTQGSLRIALDVARRLSKINTEGIDVSFTFLTNSDVVGGKSAGAAAAIGTLAALEKATIRKDVLVTGTVEADGSIGPVGKILEKAKAAKKEGFKVFLVPVSESFQNVAVEECKKRTSGRGSVMECFSTVQKVDVAKETGMNVIEVASVADAYLHFKAS